MLPTRFTITGTVMFAIGVMVFAVAFSFAATRANVVEGGSVTSTTVPTPDCDGSDQLGSIRGGDVVALGEPVCSPTPAPTRDRSDDETPTGTATVATTAVATSTPGTAPTSPPAATATQPGGGAGAGGVQPPNTGTGSSGTGTAALWLMLAGGLLALMGAGAVVTGATRRR